MPQASKWAFLKKFVVLEQVEKKNFFNKLTRPKIDKKLKKSVFAQIALKWSHWITDYFLLITFYHKKPYLQKKKTKIITWTTL